MSLLRSSHDISVYYFLIGNPITQKEIGTFVDSTEAGNSISDLNKIVDQSKIIFNKVSEDKNNLKKTKCSVNLDNFTLYYVIKSSSNNKNNSTFYLAAIKNKEISEEEVENFVFNLIEHIDEQGIKKLVGKNGELSTVGRQNLKFSIEKFQKGNNVSLKSSFFHLDSERDILYDKKERCLTEDKFIEDSKLSVNNSKLSDLSEDSTGSDNNKLGLIKKIINNPNELKRPINPPHIEEDLSEKNYKK
ncbi:MAG: hypothetical protein MJ252_13120, partial [archaeon]|nr:hypothetical protein [archaeon]